ncbi:MAG: hypothetical protein P8Y68_17435 [Anaerolineales bacterium]
MMIKRILIVMTAIALLAALSLVVYADNNGNVQINWTIAGPIFSDIQNIDAVDGGSYALLSLSAKGAPGAAEIMAVGTGGLVPVDEQCPGADLQVKFGNGGFVATFEDQSMLFFVVDESEEARNANCIHFVGPNEGAFEYNVVGGSGRFEGATGSVLVETISWGINSVLSAEEGTITGVVELP